MIVFCFSKMCTVFFEIFTVQCSEKFKAILGNVYLCVQLHACTICLCYDYPCLHVVSVDVMCMCIVELFAAQLYEIFQQNQKLLYTL